MSDIVQLVKQAAVEAVAAEKPVQILFGTVVSAQPLQIAVDGKTTYTQSMLVLSRQVTDFELDAEISMQTDESEAHTHTVSGTKKLLINNALQAGDLVALARVQNGKRYLVLDRIAAAAELEGEWI